MTDAVALMAECSNAGRWGSDDQLGTLNLITAERRVAAAALVRAGLAVSLSRPVSTVQSPVNARPAWHVMHLANRDYAAADSIHLQIHGHSTTHIDSLGHMFWEGNAYNGRRQADVVTHAGLTALDVDLMRDGIFTRGVLLDVAGAHGVGFLSVDDVVTAELLDRAERRAGTSVGAGDAVVVHTGLEARERADGREDAAVRPGLDASAVQWLHRRDVSVYAGDCIEKLPLTDGRVEMPLHQIGMVAMGLAILDCVSLTGLLATCDSLSRHDFLLTINPLRLPGATGAPVNPVALF